MSTSVMKKEDIQQNQSGLVSIIITMIIMLVLALVLLGFSQLARREQRLSLDRQLSTQAQYAAESGVNIARRYLEAHPSYDKTDCAPQSGGLDNYQDVDGPNGTVKISCILIRNETDKLQFDKVIENQSTVTPVLPTSSLASLAITWKDANKTTPTNSIYNPGGLPTKGAWGNSLGILKIDLVPTGAISPANLQNGVFTVFLRPKSGGGAVSIPFSTANNGAMVDAHCPGGPGAAICDVTITGVNAGDYAMRMTAVYNPVNVEVAGKDALGNAVNFTGVPQIDVTGRAADVLRRISVRVPSGGLSNNGSIFPTFVIDSSGDICKQIKASPLGSTNACP